MLYCSRAAHPDARLCATPRAAAIDTIDDARLKMYVIEEHMHTCQPMASDYMHATYGSSSRYGASILFSLRY